MSEKVIKSSAADLYYLPEIGALVIDEGSGKPSPKNVGETPVLKPAGMNNKIAWWGPTDNQEPHDAIKVVRTIDQLASGLYWKGRTLVSGGLVYGTTKIDDTTGEEKMIPVYDPAIDAWNRRTAIHRYLIEASVDFYTHWNQWARFRMNNGRDRIDAIECMNSAFTRVGVQNENNGKIDTAFVSANWQLSATVDDLTLKYPLIDPYFDALGQVQHLKKPEFLYPVVGPDYDYTFYATPPWKSIRESKWTDVITQIPIFKAALLKRQYTIKYHFRMSDLFWKWKFPNWDNLDAKGKDEAKKGALKELNDHMAGAERAGENLLSIDKVDPLTNTVIPGLKIESVNDPIKDGVYLEDSQEGSSHVYSAIGVDGTLVSTVPGKGGLTGSGSDKRVAYNIYIANTKPEADLILEPIQFAYDFNGFSKNYESKGGLKVWFRNYWISTLDQGKETQQQSK